MLLLCNPLPLLPHLRFARTASVCQRSSVVVMTNVVPMRDADITLLAKQNAKLSVTTWYFADAMLNAFLKITRLYVNAQRYANLPLSIYYYVLVFKCVINNEYNYYIHFRQYILILWSFIRDHLVTPSTKGQDVNK